MSDSPAWHWCPECRLAASKQGLCPGCGRGYIPVPERGVPDEPFRPTLQRAGAGIPGILMAVLMVALLGGAIFGVIDLYNHGQQLNANGQPVSASSSAAQPTASTQGTSTQTTSCTNSLGRCTFSIPSLRASITLPGVWATGPFANDKTAQAVAQVAGPVTVDLSVSSPDPSNDDADLGVVHVNSSDPTTLGGELLSLLTSATSTGNGETITWPQHRDLNVAGEPAVAQDYVLADSSGATVSEGTFYTIRGPNQLVVIQVLADQQTLFTEMEQALQNLS